MNLDHYIMFGEPIGLDMTVDLYKLEKTVELLLKDCAAI